MFLSVNFQIVLNRPKANVCLEERKSVKNGKNVLNMPV